MRVSSRTGSTHRNQFKRIARGRGGEFVSRLAQKRIYTHTSETETNAQTKNQNGAGRRGASWEGKPDAKSTLLFFFCLFYLYELGSACSRVGGAFPRKRYGQLSASRWRGFRARFMRWLCVGISSASVRCVVVCYCVSCDEPDSSIGFSVLFGKCRPIFVSRTTHIFVLR